MRKSVSEFPWHAFFLGGTVVCFFTAPALLFILFMFATIFTWPGLR